MNGHPDANRPVVVGVIGGVASGKSAVTQIFAELGAKIISADEIAHRVLGESNIIQSIVQEFGESVLQDSPTEYEPETRIIDRKKLGAMVFGNDATVRRRRLESIVHPRIRQIAKDELRAYQSQSGVEYIVLDAPLLIEGGWLPFCDKVIMVDTPNHLRRTFAMKRGWTEEEWQRRESAQIRLEEKRTRATDILVNDGAFNQLREKLLRIIEKWK